MREHHPLTLQAEPCDLAMARGANWHESESIVSGAVRQHWRGFPAGTRTVNME